MDIDLVTIIAQILNFALLVYLLKRFLYQPVLDAMDRREATIESRLTEAREKVEEAEAQKEEYTEKAEALEESKRQVMEDVRQEARERSLELHEELRQRIEHREKEWVESLMRDSTEQLESFRDEVRSEIVATVREALSDLAGRDLNQEMLETFLRQLDELTAEEVEQLRGPERPGPPLTVVTSAPLPSQQREAVATRLQAKFGDDARFEFETDSSLVAGVELRCLGHRMGWNVDDYLATLERSVKERLADITRRVTVEESDARHAVS